MIFLIKPFCYKSKKSRQKLKYLENEKIFWREIKRIFYHFLRALSCHKLSQTWECAFKPCKIRCNLLYDMIRPHLLWFYEFYALQKNTEILFSHVEILWKRSGKRIFSKKFRTRKLGKITIYYTVWIVHFGNEVFKNHKNLCLMTSQLTFIFSYSTIETLEKGGKHVQS